ncbi:MAG: UvrD-helicase domain-containing protein [Bryobacteraceae bacterium]
MTALPDQAARDRALDLTRSFIVQAPAGSGKTELLMQRYLASLATVRQPEAILAITFTRKAAAEMRRRILEALDHAAGPPPQPPHERRTWELARKARQRDRRLGWQLSLYPHRLQVRTFDSLCAALVRRMPWLSRLGASPTIVQDAHELYLAAARATVRLVESPEHGQPLARLLLHLDNDVAKLEEMLVGMLARRDQWMRHLAASRSELDAALARVIRAHLERLRQASESSLRAPYTLPASEPECLQDWKHIASLLLTKKDEWQKRPGPQAPPLEPSERLRDLLAQTRRLPAPRYDDSQWELARAVFQALELALANLRMEFRARRQADYIEVALGAIQALGSGEQPTDLMLALDCRLEHILVDEFQDTSLTQFRLLELLTAGWNEGDGRTLFLVGDPMQSIYRFREAEVGLFLKAAREGLGSVRLEPLRLEVNFRSEARLVEWFNRAFQLLLPAADDIATGAVRFSPSQPRPDAPHLGIVRIHPFIGPHLDAAEAQRVVEIVRDIQRRDPAASIAILVRARNHLPVILRALRNAGLRYRAVEIESLAEIPIVQDLLALTRALLHHADRVAWLALLRGPWCGLTLAELHTLFSSDHESTVWEVISDPGRTAVLKPEALVRLERFRQAMAPSLEHRRRSLRDWVESAWLALGGPACTAGPADLDNAEAFLRLLDQLDDGGDVALDQLEDSVSALWALPDPEAPENLQVMTIHKAKGLEFDAVILPALGRRPKSDPRRLLDWLELPAHDSGSDLLLAPPPPKGATTGPLADFLKFIEKQKSEHEAGRLLYVAATRARRELHLLGHAVVSGSEEDHKVSPDSRSLLRHLWPVVHKEFERAAAGVTAQETTPPATPPRLELRRLPAAWQRPEPPPALAVAVPLEAGELEPEEEPVSYLWVGQTLRHVGAVVHAILHRIAREGLARWDPARVLSLRHLYATLLRELGVPETELEQAIGRVVHALTATLTDPRGRWILDESHQQAENELDLTGWISGRLRRVRLDRTFVDASGIRWIIDYKTGLHEGAGLDRFLDRELERYRAQMETYAALFQQLDARPIRLGLYFPLVQGWREWGAPFRRGAP